MRTETKGLSMLPKIKREHIYLTSFSRMRVDLAAQVSKQFYRNIMKSISISSLICNAFIYIIPGLEFFRC